MACLRCNATSTIRAHLIPQVFAREVRDQATDHAVVFKNGKIRPTKNGLFDDHLLCSKCDGHLGKYEQFAFDALKFLRASTVNSLGSAIEVDGLDTDKMLRFACGLVWKYASTRTDLGRINIGPYQKKVTGDIAFANAPIPPSVDAHFVRPHTGDAEAYSYRAPMPEQKWGVNFVRFWLGGCLFRLKLDKKPNPKEWPESHWLRNRTSFLVETLPLDLIEEGRMTISMRHENAKLARFLKRVSRASAQ